MTDRIEKTIDLRAPIQRVWRALTDREEFGTWFRVKLDRPFAVGETQTGRITYEGYEHMKWRSTVVRMDPPHRFAFTWPHAEDPADPDATPDPPVTRVDFKLEEIPTGTRVTVVESGFDAIPADRRMTILRRNESGWQEQAKNISAHVEA
jgi:uncharacterized protein YndB with AHSA1/START domain